MQTVCESFHTTVRSSTAVYSVLYKSTTKLLTYTHIQQPFHMQSVITYQYNHCTHSL